MRNYESGNWGFQIIWGLRGSVFPRAFVMALPNAIACFFLSTYMHDGVEPDSDHAIDRAKNAIQMLAVFSSVQFFVLFFRSNVAYSRWWEGGTLLQKTRGEWFNSYSSLMAFSTTDPKKAEEVEAFHHMLARLMSLLFCVALEQVSPNKDNTCFEIIDLHGLERESIDFLMKSPDKVEVLLQWVQRATVINAQTGVLPIAPPILSRAFQEISRGIVNLQNARKIADFPFPFPYAQMSMTMLLIHYLVCPVFASMMLHRSLAVVASFLVVFFLWCINFIALQLEYPFGDRDNDLPMRQFQRDWNKSVGTLMCQLAQRPPAFEFEPAIHRKLEIINSDGSSCNGKRVSLTFKLGATIENLEELELDSKLAADYKKAQLEAPRNPSLCSSDSTDTPASPKPKASISGSESLGASSFADSRGSKCSRKTNSTSSAGSSTGKQAAMLADILSGSLGKPQSRPVASTEGGTPGSTSPKEGSPRPSADRASTASRDLGERQAERSPNDGRSSLFSRYSTIAEDDEAEAKQVEGDADVEAPTPKGGAGAHDRAIWQRLAVVRAQRATEIAAQKPAASNPLRPEDAAASSASSANPPVIDVEIYPGEPPNERALVTM